MEKIITLQHIIMLSDCVVFNSKKNKIELMPVIRDL